MTCWGNHVYPLFSTTMAPNGRNVTTVRFQVRADVPHGVNIRLSGSLAQLGYFSPASSIEMYTSPQEY